jgi:hypothetical protein
LQNPIDDGAAARSFVNFDSLLLHAYSISADGKTLVAARGNTSTEAILLENF